MRIYFCYKFRNYINKVSLKSKLETISELLEHQGHSTYIYWRDNQKWSTIPSKDKPQSVIIKAFHQIRDSDVLFAFTDTQDVSKADLVISSLQGITWEKLKIVEENLPHSH